MNSTEIACPNCERPTTAGHLNQWHGVCEFCRKAFQAANKSWINGTETKERASEAPAIHPHRDFGDAMETTEAIDFDWQKIDENVFGLKAGSTEEQRVADALARIFVWTWEARTLRGALGRFTALFAGTHPHLVAKTGSQIGQELGTTKQNVSKAMMLAQRAFGMKFSRTRSATARAHMKEARLSNPADRHTRRGGRHDPGD